MEAAAGSGCAPMDRMGEQKHTTVQVIPLTPKHIHWHTRTQKQGKKKKKEKTNMRRYKHTLIL